VAEFLSTAMKTYDILSRPYTIHIVHCGMIRAQIWNHFCLRINEFLADIIVCFINLFTYLLT